MSTPTKRPLAASAKRPHLSGGIIQPSATPGTNHDTSSEHRQRSVSPSPVPGSRHRSVSLCDSPMPSELPQTLIRSSSVRSSPSLRRNPWFESPVIESGKSSNESGGVDILAAIKVEESSKNAVDEDPESTSLRSSLRSLNSSSGSFGTSWMDTSSTDSPRADRTRRSCAPSPDSRCGKSSPLRERSSLGLHQGSPVSKGNRQEDNMELCYDFLKTTDSMEAIGVGPVPSVGSQAETRRTDRGSPKSNPDFTERQYSYDQDFPDYLNDPDDSFHRPPCSRPFGRVDNEQEGSPDADRLRSDSFGDLAIENDYPLQTPQNRSLPLERLSSGYAEAPPKFPLFPDYAGSNPSGPVGEPHITQGSPGPIFESRLPGQSNTIILPGESGRRRHSRVSRKFPALPIPETLKLLTEEPSSPVVAAGSIPPTTDAPPVTPSTPTLPSFQEGEASKAAGNSKNFSHLLPPTKISKETSQICIINSSTITPPKTIGTTAVSYTQVYPTKSSTPGNIGGGDELTPPGSPSSCGSDTSVQAAVGSAGDAVKKGGLEKSIKCVNELLGRDAGGVIGGEHRE